MRKIRMLSGAVIGDGQGIGQAGKIYEVKESTARILVGQGSAELVDSEVAVDGPPEPEPVLTSDVPAEAGEGRGRRGRS